MSDIFISYSRKDVDFVRQLYAALVEEDFSVWVDWEGIPPSAEWLAEIYQAIEAADSFIFVTSAASCCSEICRLELQHAIQHNKRLLPVVIEDLDTGGVPAVLAKLNWLFFRPDDDFKQSFGLLLTALKTDLDWVKAHTSLLNKAIEWQNKAQDSSLLLRGKELAAVGKEVAQCSASEPALTGLQNRYLAVSRATAKKRSRLISAGSVLLLLILGGISWFAYQQNLAKQAERTAKQAERKAKVINNAQGLASKAMLLQRDQGILGAIEAAQLLTSVTPEINTTVHNALIEKARSYRIKTRRGAHELVFSKDNKLVATFDRGEVIQRWALCLQQGENPLCAKDPHKDLVINTEQRKPATGISSDADRAVLADGHQLKIYTLDEKANLACSKALALNNTAWFLRVSPDAQWASIPYGGSWENRFIASLDCEAGQPLESDFQIAHEGYANRITASAFDAESEHLYTGLINGELHKYNLEQRSSKVLEQVFENPRRIEKLVISRNGRWLAAAYESSVQLVDLRHQALRAKRICCRGNNTRFGMAFNHASTKLAIYHQAGQKKQISLLDLTKPDFPQQLSFNVPYKQHDEPNTVVQSIAFSQDDQWLAAGLNYGNNDILLWPLGTENLIRLACSRLDDQTKCPLPN